MSLIKSIADEEMVKADVALALQGVPPDQQRRALELAEDLFLSGEATVSAGRETLRTLRLDRLERNDCSRLHKLKDAIKTERVFNDSKQFINSGAAPILLQFEQTFVVKHDWAGAFSGADVGGAQFILPYDLCAFEFRIDGHNFIALAIGPERADELFEPDSIRQSPDQAICLFMEVGACWYFPDVNQIVPTMDCFTAHVRAICIALDAEVATHSIVRAPHKLNQKRERAGRTPLMDYHIVDLARRHRLANPLPSTGAGTKKRLHFRRGHWRHFETSKTWVKWCLVGDPDLGFISKQYTL